MLSIRELEQAPAIPEIEPETKAGPEDFFDYQKIIQVGFHIDTN